MHVTGVGQEVGRSVRGSTEEVRLKMGEIHRPWRRRKHQQQQGVPVRLAAPGAVAQIDVQERVCAIAVLGGQVGAA